MPTIVQIHRNTVNPNKVFISVLDPNEIEIFVLNKAESSFESVYMLERKQDTYKVSIVYI